MLKNINEIKDNEIEASIMYAMAFIGKPYVYGSNGPNSFDCSGLVMEYLKSLGIVGPKEDLGAQQIFDRFSKFTTATPKRGNLIFYGKDTSSIYHVEILLTGSQSIGASGGTSVVDSVEDAEKANAFVRVRNIFRMTPVAIVNIGELK